MDNTSSVLVAGMKLSNGTTLYHPKSYWPALTTWFSILLTVCILGSLSNALFLLIILKQRRLRSGCGILIGHLILTYLLMCSLHFPINGLLVYGRNFWFILPKNICKYVHYLQAMTIYASNWAEAGLAINRSIAIIFPHHYRAWTTPKVCLSMVTLCWILSSTTLLPFCFDVAGVFVASADTGQCVLLGKSKWGYFLLTFNSYMPYLVVGVASFSILAKILLGRILSRSRTGAVLDANHGRPGKLLEQQLLARRLKVARMLFISFLFCVICNLPISLMATFFRTFYVQSPLLSLWLRICLLSQYAFNPVSCPC